MAKQTIYFEKSFYEAEITRFEKEGKQYVRIELKIDDFLPDGIPYLEILPHTNLVYEPEQTNSSQNEKCK